MKQRVITVLAALIGSALVLGIASGPASATVRQYQHLTKGGYITIADVVDGDTVHVYTHGIKTSIRLIGINTPEIAHGGWGYNQCGGQAAFAKAKYYIKSGARLYVSWDYHQGEWDKYGRSLRYIYVHGNDFGGLMLRSGLAKTAYDSGSYGTHRKRASYHRLDAAYHYPRCYALRV